MGVNELLKARVNRKTRSGKPYAVFYDSFVECEAAGEAILDGPRYHTEN